MVCEGEVACAPQKRCVAVTAGVQLLFARFWGRRQIGRGDRLRTPYGAMAGLNGVFDCQNSARQSEV
jgi:hypothetical protein